MYIASYTLYAYSYSYIAIYILTYSFSLNYSYMYIHVAIYIKFVDFHHSSENVTHDNDHDDTGGSYGKWPHNCTIQAAVSV